MMEFAETLLLIVLSLEAAGAEAATRSEPAPTMSLNPPSNCKQTDTFEPWPSSYDRALADDRIWNDYRYGGVFYESDRFLGAGSTADIAQGFRELQPLLPPAEETATGFRVADPSFPWASVTPFAPRGLMPIPIDPDDLLMQDAKGESDLGVGYQFFGTPAVVRLNANVTLDTTYDTGAFTNPAGLNPSFLALDGSAAARGRGTFDMGLSSANLKSDIQLPSRTAWTQSYFDLELNEDEVEFRQLYARIETFLGGMYWTTFGDEGTLPQTIVANGAPAGAVYRPRQVQLHYTVLLASGWSIAGAIERPSGTDLTLPVDASPLRRYPDLVGAIRYQPGDWESIQVAALLRPLGFEDAAGNEEFAAGWGVAGNVRFFTYGYDNFRLGVVGGQGLGSYLFGLAGNSAAAYADGSQLKPLANFGGYAGYQHYWTPALSSNVAYGFCDSETVVAVPESADTAHNAWINLIWNLMPARVAVGIEYQYGFRDVSGGVSGDNHHIQFSLQVGGGYVSDRTTPTRPFAVRTYGFDEYEAVEAPEPIPYNRSRRL